MCFYPTRNPYHFGHHVEPLETNLLTSSMYSTAQLPSEILSAVEITVLPVRHQVKPELRRADNKPNRGRASTSEEISQEPPGQSIWPL